MTLESYLSAMREAKKAGKPEFKWEGNSYHAVLNRDASIRTYVRFATTEGAEKCKSSMRYATCDDSKKNAKQQCPCKPVPRKKKDELII